MQNPSKYFMIACTVLAMLAGAATGNEPSNKSQQDLGAMVRALSERLEAQGKRLENQNAKISTLESKLTDEALQAARHEDIAKVMSDMQADAGTRDALPQWIDNLKFFGDLRLRYEHHSADGSQIKDRNRYRFRLRFGAVKSWLDDQMKVAFRLASGDSASGRSTNQTMTGAWSKKDIWIDQAYAVYSPNAIPGLTVIGGKMPNVLEHTDLMFDSDVNPEGFGVAYHRKIAGIDVFGTYANLILNESRTGHDPVANVYQGGFKAPLPGGINATFAATWYDFENYEDLGLTVNGWNRNTQLVNVLAKAKFKALGLPWQVYVDWVHNTQDNDETSGFENADDGYALGVKVGKNKKMGDWSVGYQYKYIEMNATCAALNDADFGTPDGLGTNVKGHVVKAAYNLTDFLTVGGNVFLVQPIIGDRDENDFLMQFDLVWKF
jgi:hypothetical protein